MKRVQIFSDTSEVALQDKINHWITDNKEVEIITTNMTSCTASQNGMHGEKLVFYILYTPANAEAKEMGVLAQQENPMVITTEIKPNVLQQPDQGMLNISN